MKSLVLTLALWLPLGLLAQCKHPVPVTDSLVNELTNPYQLTCIHTPPVNRLDTLVQKLYLTSSPMECRLLIDSIGMLRSEDAYCFLFTMCCRSPMIDDLNPYNAFSGRVTYYGGFQVLNAYFLPTPLPVDTSDLNHKIQNDGEIARACWAYRVPECECCPHYPDHSITTRGEHPYHPNSHEVHDFDQKVIQLINRHSRLGPPRGFLSYADSLDAIVYVLNHTPYVQQALWDKCTIKNDLYPGNAILAVRVEINGGMVERCYQIQLGVNIDMRARVQQMLPVQIWDAMRFLSVEECPGFIEAEILRCEGK